MSTFKNREDAYEAAFAHDEEMRFKAKAHRNKSFADWAAGIMQLPPTQTAAYRDSIIDMTLGNDSDERVLQRIREDLAASGHSIDEADLRQHLHRLMTDAMAAVQAS